MPKRIPSRPLRRLAKEQGLSHVILYAHDVEGRAHVVTWGRTITECDEAAGFGNRMKDALHWPGSLQSQPSRVRALQARVRELEALLAKGS